MSDSIRKYAIELIGTFFFAFTVIAAVSTRTPFAAIAIGGVLMILIYAGGHISGGHYNPAVSVAAFIRGRLSASDLASYIGAQIVGSTLGALLARWYFTNSAPAALSGKGMWQALVIETLFTFLLAFVVLNVATSKDHPNNSFYGLAIGFTVVVGAIAVGPLSGAVFNPAIGFGISLAQLSAWGSFWIYIVGPIVGGAIAGAAFKLLNPEDA